MRINCKLVLIIASITLSACSLKTSTNKNADLNPYLKAISDAGELRDSLGFTLMIDTTQVSIEKGGQFCDVMLHVSQEHSIQTIAFKKTDNGFEWIGEEERFLGPRYMTTSKGDIKEAIVLSYAKAPVFYHAPGHLNIAYQTPDSTRDASPNLAVASSVLPESEARAMIKTWAKTY